MKSDLEVAWCNATQNERQSFIELYADDIFEMLPTYDDRDRPEIDELIGHEQDGDDDEQLDPTELPAVMDTNRDIECSVNDDDGNFFADYDEDFRGAKRGNRHRAGGKRVPAAPDQAEIERLTKEFLKRGGEITRVGRGVSGVQPLQPRTPAWRKIATKRSVKHA